MRNYEIKNLDCDLRNHNIVVIDAMQHSTVTGSTPKIFWIEILNVPKDFDLLKFSQDWVDNYYEKVPNVWATIINVAHIKRGYICSIRRNVCKVQNLEPIDYME